MWQRASQLGKARRRRMRLMIRFIPVSLPVAILCYPIIRAVTTTGERSRAMLAQVKVRDEQVFSLGRPPVEFVVDMPSERVSIREFIRARVEQEVAGYNAQQGEYFHG